MDWSVLHALNDFLYSHDGFEDPLLFYVNASEALFAATLAVIFFVASGARHVAWRRAAVAAALSTGLALAIGKAIAELVDRARPFVSDAHGVHLFAAHSADPGFPSDHATASFAIATAIFLRNRRWGLVALIAAAVLSVGRVAIGVHFPSDVLAGAALGAAVAIALWARPLRDRVDALSDWLGGHWDRALGWGAGLVGLSWRP
ncbi:MAG: phosphatase PAP2 family protein [Nitrososphaerota archaeon]